MIQRKKKWCVQVQVNTHTHTHTHSPFTYLFPSFVLSPRYGPAPASLSFLMSLCIFLHHHKHARGETCPRMLKYYVINLRTPREYPSLTVRDSEWATYPTYSHERERNKSFHYLLFPSYLFLNYGTLLFTGLFTCRYDTNFHNSGGIER